MKTRKCGYSDLNLTTIGLGTWAHGGEKWQFGWGVQEDADSVASIIHSVECGINWIDTAAAYGLGHAEEVVGKALKELPERPIIATKCSRVWDENRILSGSLKRDSIRREAEDSLKRLDIDVIDLYQVHWPNPESDLEEAWGAIAELIQEGKIRYAGVSNFSIAQMEKIKNIHPIASLQPPYSMLRRDIETKLIDYCAKNDIGVIAYSPMQKGLLTGKMTRERANSLTEGDHRKNDPMFSEPRLSPILEFVDGLKEIALKEGKTVAQLSLAWVLRRSEITSAIVGARNPRQIEETAQAGKYDLSSEIIDKIEELMNQRL